MSKQFNPLFDEFPTAVKVGGNSFTIDTDFKLYLKLILALKNENEQDIIDILRLILPVDYILTEHNIKETVEAISEFMTLLDANVTTSNKAPTFDFVMDSDVLYSDFRRKDIYDLDLNTHCMHWLEFKMLLNGLPETSSTEQRKRLRSLKIKDVAKEKQADLIQWQKAYSIKAQHSKEQEELLDYITQIEAKKRQNSVVERD